MRIVELPKITGFRCARGSNLARLYSQIRLTQATFGDKVAVCDALVDMAKGKAGYGNIWLTRGRLFRRKQMVPPRRQ